MISDARAKRVREAILRADPHLSKFRPLEEIIFYDDFDQGLRGWLEVIGNFEGSIDNITYYPELFGARPPMLSTATMPDTGSQGSLAGTYAMKVTTRPIRGHVAKALKRLTYKRLATCDACSVSSTRSRR